MGKLRRVNENLGSLADKCDAIVLGKIEVESEQEYEFSKDGFSLERKKFSKLERKDDPSITVESVKFEVEKVLKGKCKKGKKIEVFMCYNYERKLKRITVPKCSVIKHQYEEGKEVDVKERVVLFLKNTPIKNSKKVINKNGFRLFCGYSYESPQKLEEIVKVLEDLKKN